MSQIEPEVPVIKNTVWESKFRANRLGISVAAALILGLLLTVRYLGLVRLEDELMSIAKDAAIWVLLGPLIFRPNFALTARAWEAELNKTPDTEAIDFRSNRFLVYYSVHITTFIVAWILFQVRYFPELVNLLVYLKNNHTATIDVHDTVFGILSLVAALVGVFGFWLHPVFAAPKLIRAYRQHNQPRQDEPTTETLLGPLNPPPCTLTIWRQILFWTSLIAAGLYPVV